MLEGFSRPQAWWVGIIIRILRAQTYLLMQEYKEMQVYKLAVPDQQGPAEEWAKKRRAEIIHKIRPIVQQ